MLSQKILKAVNAQFIKSTVACSYSHRSFNNDISKVNPENFARGTGGRSSFNGNVVTVFGATGLIGKNIVNQLAKIGTQVIIPYRLDPYDVRYLKVLGDLGQILFIPFTIRDDEAMRNAIKHSNCVINLIGRDVSTNNFGLEEVHVETAGKIARLCTEYDVEKLIHFSALGASEDVKPMISKKPSSFLITKAKGEKEVIREFPHAVIFRPSDIYGQMDRFIFYFNSSSRRLRFFDRTYVPLYRLGRETYKQPVHAMNVAQGVVQAVLDHECHSRVIQAVGPHRYRLDHLVKWLLLVMRYRSDRIYIIPLNRYTNPYFNFKLAAFEFFRNRNPPVSWERLERECISNDPDPTLQTLEDLGVQLFSLEDRIHYEYGPFKRFKSYWDAVNEFPLPPNPPIFNLH